jgi:hypothetical protein
MTGIVNQGNYHAKATRHTRRLFFVKTATNEGATLEET